MKPTFPVDKFRNIQTPFYYYDVERLKDTLRRVRKEADRYHFKVHYALKANSNPRILEMVRDHDFGADCVSGQEVLHSVRHGFDPDDIVFAGVGKSDHEIRTGLENRIACFNVESIPEMEVINTIAGGMNLNARIAIRINPNVDPLTHHYITTGLEENKFGISAWELDEVAGRLHTLKHLKLTGIHFHIGSQITGLDVFKSLCLRVNQFHEWFRDHQLFVDHINVGGGLGVDYHHPDDPSFPDFPRFFGLFNEFLHLLPGQTLHFELGRALVAHAGNLITRVLYIKKGVHTRFAIVDAGMTELLRPALYQAYHKIENITSTGPEEKYDVVGPICESADTFGKAVPLASTRRDDLLAIRSTGAYGEVMVSNYNLREKVRAYYSDAL